MPTVLTAPSDGSARRWRRAAATGAAAIAAFAAAPSAGLADSGVGQPPPEWGLNARSWPSHNYDLANTRATTAARINSRNVSRLRVKWRLPLEGSGFFGVFSSNPIVVNGTVYLQDLHSNVYAVNRDTGQLRWKRTIESLSAGPNGVAYAYGKILGTTATGAFALDARTGTTIWSRELVEGAGGVDMTPQPYDHTLIVSTVPGTIFAGYQPGAMGTVIALDERTGAVKWRFNTIKGGDLWGHPELNSGGGVWFPPAVDHRGRVFFGVGNAAPFPGTPEYPNGSSRPGPNLYTNSLVAVDGKTGRLLWYRQVAPHDVRDHDLQGPPILTRTRIRGVETDIVVISGKVGRVYAYRADNGAPLWQRPVGRHENDSGPLPDQPITVFPGFIGGVISPMALADDTVFVPWLDAGSEMSSTGPLGGGLPDLTQARGGLTAVRASTGTTAWEQRLPTAVFGAATVANDVVFTSTWDGTIYAFQTATGRLLWSTKARAGINSFPAIDDDMLLVGASAPGFFEQPVSELIAYSLR